MIESGHGLMPGRCTDIAVYLSFEGGQDMTIAPKGQTAMRVAAMVVVTLSLSACVWKSDYNALLDRYHEAQDQNRTLSAENQQLKTQLTQSQAEQNFEEAGDLLFPSGGFELSPQGQTELATNVVPKLKTMTNIKIVVYGYTDNAAVGRDLVKQGIPDNLVLSTRRAASVASFLVAQGINPNIVSAKGFGDTHPKTSNDTPQGRAENRRIVITVQGPGAAPAS
jgi:chemotaxis protein MotB